MEDKETRLERIASMAWELFKTRYAEGGDVYNMGRQEAALAFEAAEGFNVELDRREAEL